MTTRVLDAAEYIHTEEDVIGFLDAAMETGAVARIADCLGIVARSEGMTAIARRTGVARQALYHALSEAGNPTLATLTAVLDALGLRMRIERKAA